MLSRIFIVALLCFLPGVVSASVECVVLLHGLARVSNSMAELERKLRRATYEVINISYPSRSHPIDALATDAVGRGITQCRGRQADTINFVTHSLGGILLRQYLQHEPIKELGRVVMLGPPNQGSELVDGLLPVPGFKLFGGPAGVSLGTGNTSLVASLGAVDFDLGVIAGDTNVNPLNVFLISGPNDSIVSVESTKVEGMNDHRVLPVIHTFMMRDNEVIDEAIHYLKTGAFIPRAEVL